jgi:hypothetical protein
MDRDEMSILYRGYWSCHRCFLPSFGSFGKGVSEEKIFLEIDQSETRFACGSQNRNLVGSNYGRLCINYKVSSKQNER